MEGSGTSSSSCTVTYVSGTASVSCVNSTSSGYQVILLQVDAPYNLIVVNITSGENQTVPVVPGDRYCIMELEYNDSEIKYSGEFTADFTTDFTKDFTTEETTRPPSTVDVIGIASKLALSVVWRLRVSICSRHHYSWCCGTVHIHDIDRTNNCCNSG